MSQPAQPERQRAPFVGVTQLSDPKHQTLRWERHRAARPTTPKSGWRASSQAGSPASWHSCRHTVGCARRSGHRWNRQAASSGRAAARRLPPAQSPLLTLGSFPCPLTSRHAAAPMAPHCKWRCSTRSWTRSGRPRCGARMLAAGTNTALLQTHSAAHAPALLPIDLFLACRCWPTTSRRFPASCWSMQKVRRSCWQAPCI